MNMDLGLKALSDVTVFSKYAKFLPEVGRRETWDEIVDRYEIMMYKKYPHLKDEIIKNAIWIREKKVLPSMRALQFAGPAMEVNNARGFNCAYLPIDSYHAFSEIMFLLLGGSGVGYSVQRHHISQLPAIQKNEKTRKYLIQDSIIGWADAIKVLMKGYFGLGTVPEFDYRDIRPKGARLVTAGGKAPGPEPLKICVAHIQAILDRKKDGEKLSPLECHDILCHVANSVLAGGIRRSAMISLFDINDEEMVTCKYGNWWELNEQRGRANNSAVLVRGEVSEQQFFDLWERIELSGSGEPGIYWTNDRDWGTNPSLRKGTKVWTSEGIFPIEELEDKNFTVRNLSGELSPARCWLSGRNQKLWEISLKGGHKYYATKEHEWPVLQDDKTWKKVKSPDLSTGDLMPVTQTTGLGFGKKGSYDDGFLAGWHLGDGWTTFRKEGYLQQGLICTEKDEVKGRLISCLRSLGIGANFSDREGTYELNTSDRKWNEFQKYFGYSFKSEGLPTSVWKDASEDFRQGLIDGLFGSDGSVDTKKKRLTFTSKYEKLAKDVSELLGFYGIKTSVKESISVLNGKSFTRFDVRIGGQNNIKHFRKVFTLSVPYKREALASLSWKDTKKDDNSLIEVVNVRETELSEDVWDISVKDETHCFRIAHVVTGNCCEIGLRGFQFCNLCEVNVSDVEDQQELSDRVAVAAFFGTLQAGFTDFHYLRPIWQKTTEKDALLGIGMTGIGSGKVLGLNLQQAATIAKDVNKTISEKIGINPAARITCVKPSGTTSCVLGTSSGIHAWHSPYYLRTLRFGKDEDIAKYLMINHPEVCEDDTLRPKDTLCVRFPIKAPKGSIFRTETALDTLERVKKFATEWIITGHVSGENTHNVSATISIDKNRKYYYVDTEYDENEEMQYEWREIPELYGKIPTVKDNIDYSGVEDEWWAVGSWMWRNKEFYNGISVLDYDGGSYIQAPFQEISEDEYGLRIGSIRELDLTNVIEDDDNVHFGQIASCSGGKCELE